LEISVYKNRNQIRKYRVFKIKTLFTLVLLNILIVEFDIFKKNKMEKGLIVITGGSRGIGKAIVLKFLGEGYKVIACGRNLDRLKELENLAQNASLHIFQADVSKKNEVKAFADFVLDFKTPIAVLVHNAGVFEQSNMLIESEDTLARLLDTNVLSAYYLSKFLNNSLEKGSHIFTICSIASLGGYAQSGSYATSKFALLGFTKSLRLELILRGIKVTAVNPGATDTDSWNGSGIPSERFIQSEDIADMVWATYKLSPSAVVEELLIRPTLGDI
jgi:NAD(P)-dependent dehydrogenase (short-subunit alcohol dehydrogenase family)